MRSQAPSSAHAVAFSAQMTLSRNPNPRGGEQYSCITDVSTPARKSKYVPIKSAKLAAARVPVVGALRLAPERDIAALGYVDPVASSHSVKKTTSARTRECEIS